MEGRRCHRRDGPQDPKSHGWKSAVAAGCGPDSVQAIAGSAKKVPDASGAVASGWSFLVPCVPALSLESFEATFDPAQVKWVVVTKPASSDGFGTWTIDPESGGLGPYDVVSRQWDSAVGLGCGADLLKTLLKPTPVVEDIGAAVSNLWFYAVKCSPAVTVADLQATWNPVSGEFIVITSPDSATDYGVWTVRQDGPISPGNKEASRRALMSTGSAC